MGLLLRFVYVWPVEGINFQFLMHGHSHVAMLGWVYLILYCLIIHFYIPKKEQEKPVFNRLFWITQIAVIGMMVDFPVQGYAFISIFFSTLHIFCSYYFVFLIWKKAKTNTVAEQKMLRAALFFMVISTFGVWCLGPAVGMLGKASAFYQIAIQFFLHFQFNGWFLFAVLALFFKQYQLKIEEHTFRLSFNLLVIATIMTLALPVSWYLSHAIFYWINAVGVVIQLLAAILFVKQLQPQFSRFYSSLSKIERTVYLFTLFSLGLKIVIQLVVLIPEMAHISHQIRNFVVGYIHLTMLGIITGFLFGLVLQNNFISAENTVVKWGIGFFLLGYAATEILLFLQGTYLLINQETLPDYYLNVFIVSIPLPLGLLGIVLGEFIINGKKFKQQNLNRV
ncbi:hypothetical protein [Flavobacterium adhaerens]|uniref:hypothetical protein n=1 Tax=Flavobacterium adhaerens TaxID=3149043 RepID=UPI0032B56837